ncbi:MAG: peptidase domain-containing ABC transporter, partial [Bacilli bacterium]|nr:peptidase domain-containing ABC transporter [Bacilli bacterium]
MIKKYPFTKQDNIKDCGVCCLQMVVKYYKGYVEKEELRNMTKTSKQGTTAYHIIEAAKELGFEAYGVKCQIDDLNKESVMTPAIAHVCIDKKYPHFIVIYEVNKTKGYLIVADPATKIKKITLTDFNKIWSGTLIFFYPILRIPYQKNNYKLFTFINALLKSQKHRLIKIVLSSLLITILSIINSFYFKLMIDNINLTINKLYIIFTCFIIFLTIQQITIYLRNKLLILYDKHLLNDLHNYLFSKIISLPYHYYSNRSSGEIMTYFDKASNIKKLIIDGIVFLFVDLPLAILSFILMYIISKDLLFVMTITITLILVMTLITSKLIKINVKKAQSTLAILNNHIITSVNDYETVKGLNIITKLSQLFRKKHNDLLKKIYQLEKTQVIQDFIVQFVKQINYYVIILIGILAIIDNKLSIGQLLVIISLQEYIITPFSIFPNLLNSYNESYHVFNKMGELFYYNKKAQPLEMIPKGDISIKKLSFSYDNVTKHLDNIDLEIKQGEKVCLTGVSGSGKSTLLKILMKYYPVKNNQINISDNDINIYNQEFYLNYVSYISQSEIIFNGTLYDNLTMADDNNISELVKECCIDEIFNNNLGFNTLIEENGFNLSGGEKQRLVLARTLAKNFNLLFIDEGLSQMDISLERKILKNMFNRFKDKTIVISSHRLDNMDLFDKVIQMENGKIKDV